ncbi:MAG: metal-dependent hydrolase [Acidobacteriota bacterium]
MFIGHIAVGLAAKRLAPRTSLGLLIAAPLALDLLWPVFVLAGWERVRIEPGNTAFAPLAFDHYPWSHSLAMSAVWGAALALAYWSWRRYRAGAVVLGLAVLSHWALDALTHRPDMPLYPGGPRVGLGLWNSVEGTIAVEAAMFAAGLWLYGRTTKPRDRTGRYAYFAFAAFLGLVYTGNASGSPPPGVRELAFVALSMWIFALWAWWFDAHRYCNESITRRLEKSSTSKATA